MFAALLLLSIAGVVIFFALSLLSAPAAAALARKRRAARETLITSRAVEPHARCPSTAMIAMVWIKPRWRPNSQRGRDRRKRRRRDIEACGPKRTSATGRHASPSPARNSTCSANQTARLRITPTTAAVIAASAPASCRLRAQLLDERRAGEDPQKSTARRWSMSSSPRRARPPRPASNGAASRKPRGNRRTASPGSAGPAWSRRGRGRRPSRARFSQPCVSTTCLRHVGEQRIGAAEAHHRELGEEHPDLTSTWLGAERQRGERDRRPPDRRARPTTAVASLAPAVRRRAQRCDFASALRPSCCGDARATKKPIKRGADRRSAETAR